MSWAGMGCHAVDLRGDNAFDMHDSVVVYMSKSYLS